MRVDQARAVANGARRHLVAVVAVSLVTVLLAAVPGASESSDAPAGPPRALAGTLAAGDQHNCVIVAGGDVKCWGKIFDGQLGQGNQNAQGDSPGEMAALVAIQLGTGLTATAVSAGDEHSCALIDTGDVKCWGDN